MESKDIVCRLCVYGRVKDNSNTLTLSSLAQLSVVYIDYCTRRLLQV